ncbi:hypothetical protein [Streptomyces sp. SYSU K21746]
MDHEGVSGWAGVPPVPDGVRVSVAVGGLDSGTTVAYGAGSFVTASLVKVDILAALLMRAQDAGRELTARERACADAMIRVSDNDAATELWQAIGGADGLAAAHARLGLVATEPAASGAWGLTRTTARNRLALLAAVFGTGPVLGASSRTYLQGLMAGVRGGRTGGCPPPGRRTR